MSKSGLFLNASGVASTFSSLGSAIPSSAKSNMQVAVLYLESEVKKRAPVDTGHLRGSYEGRVVESGGDRTVGEVGTNVEYGAYQEFLYTPHIRPAVDENEQKLVKMMGADTITEAVSHAR